MSLGLFQKAIFLILVMFNIFFRMRLFRLGPIKKQMTSMYNNSTLFKSKPWQYTDNAIDVCLSKTFPNAAVRSKNRFAPNHASIQPILTMISNLFQTFRLFQQGINNSNNLDCETQGWREIDLCHFFPRTAQTYNRTTTLLSLNCRNLDFTTTNHSILLIVLLLSGEL